MSSSRRVIPLVMAVVAVTMLLAGCHGGPSGTGSGSASGTSKATPKPSRTPSHAPSRAPTAPAPTTTPDATGCLASQLQVVYSPGDNTAGHAHGVLTFGNLGQQDCLLTGYPTVTFQNPVTQQPMGQPAGQDPSEGTAPANASVDGFSTADLTTTRAGFVDGCTIVTATALLVKAPGLSHLFVVPIEPTDACSNPSIGLLTVSANYIPDGS